MQKVRWALADRRRGYYNAGERGHQPVQSNLWKGLRTLEKAVFYREWLPLPKAEFNILAMLAEQGGLFSGNYSDMCGYLGVTSQSNNRQTLRAAVESLARTGFITHESRGRTQILKVVPKATEIPLPRSWVQSVIHHDYSSESVAFAQILKVCAWIAWNEMPIITNDMIAADLSISTSTVVSAKNVLEREYENITKKRISEKVGENFFRNLGQELRMNAWWTDI